MNTDNDWELWGRKDPYYGVITDERFRRDKLDDAARLAFFDSGRLHVEYLLAQARAWFDPQFAPDAALDFGCGVGRVLVGLAGASEQVLGLDVSAGMLEEARRNCDAAGLSNVRLGPSSDDLGAFYGAFDLVHTCIVLQHIDPVRGTSLFRELLRCLRPGGVGAIQVTYAKMHHADTLGRDPNQPPVLDLQGQSKTPSKRWRAALTGAAAVASSVGVEIDVDPVMHMFSYDMNALMFLMQSAGVRRFHVDFTDHGGELGAFLFFQSPTSE